MIGPAPAASKLPPGPHLVLCTPNYGGGAHNISTMLSLWQSLSDPEHRWGGIHHSDPRSSLLALNFNIGWCEALNLRAQGVAPLYFLLLHSDIIAKSGDWFTTLFQEMASHRAEVLSVVVPIKDSRGLTSTARNTDRWRPVRYTLAEIARQPITWTAPDLLVNTGMLLVDMRREWVERVCFTVNDTIAHNPVTGRWEADVEPEDWSFSRQCHALGVQVWATRAVAVTHLGESGFDSDAVWGDPVDHGNLASYGAAKLAEVTERRPDNTAIGTMREIQRLEATRGHGD